MRERAYRSGSGAISLALAKRSPEATVWAVDPNERARALTEANAARNGLANIRVAAPDELPDDVTFNTIWSNPPIRIGKQALHDLLLRWLNRLAGDGTETVEVLKEHPGVFSHAVLR